MEHWHYNKSKVVTIIKAQRILLHSDINHCYAQIEEMKYPNLRNVAMAVGGNEKQRHGIILAKNDLAKTYGIQTGETLRDAYAKCPHLKIIAPHYEEYLYYSEKVKDIYRRYSDKVESYGIDEAWIDASEVVHLYGSGMALAKTIQTTVWNEVGLSISIGVSYNKIFAKMASAMVKYKGLVEINEDNFQEHLYHLPIEKLFYVGPATKRKLAYFSIFTIKDFASHDPSWIHDQFGKIGDMLLCFAHGKDNSEVCLSTHHDQPKSIGNGITTKKDMVCPQDAKLVFYVLVEAIAARLKEQQLCGDVIAISLRNTQLQWVTRQEKMRAPTTTVAVIMEVVMKLLAANYDFNIPLRSVHVCVSNIQATTTFQQLNLFVDEENQHKQNALENALFAVRGKYGFGKIQRCSMLLDTELTNFNPKEDHVIFPIAFL